MKLIFLLPAVGIITISLLTALSIENAVADRDDKPKKGSNGQCRKLQSSFPPELQDYEGCHDTFTGKGHNDDDDDPPLP